MKRRILLKFCGWLRKTGAPSLPPLKLEKDGTGGAL